MLAFGWQGAESLVPGTQNDIRTSKSVQNPQSFPLLTSKCASRHNGVHFFDSSTSKSSPKLGGFFAFSLANVLRATTVCIFSPSIPPDGSAPAALASLLFDPLEPQIIGKTQWIATFLPFRAPGSSFFWLVFDLLSSFLLFSDSSHLCFSSVHIVGSVTSKLPSTIRWYYMILYYGIISTGRRKKQKGAERRREKKGEESRQEKGEEWRGGSKEDTNREKRGKERGALGSIDLFLRWAPG